MAWPHVQAFLQSIDRSDPFGRRDFALLYLAAAAGLRKGELVRLTPDDIDWPSPVLRIRQTKTRQTLRLPLTDEAACVLIDYLRNARPKSTLRHLFLRMRAPSFACSRPLFTTCWNIDFTAALAGDTAGAPMLLYFSESPPSCASLAQCICAIMPQFQLKEE